MVSKYQTLYQKITSDPEFQSFSPQAQLVFYTIKFCKENNAANLFELYTETLSKRNGLTQKEVEKGIKELEEKNWIKREGELMWIVKGMKNNPSFTMNNPKHQIALLSCLNELPKAQIVLSFMQFYNLTNGVFKGLYDTVSDRVSIGYANHIDVSVSVSETISVTETVTEAETVCPHQSIINLYHEILPELPKVVEWTTARQDFLRTRWNEKKERQNLDWWKNYFIKVSNSDYLTGKKIDFRANLEWLVRPRNFIKVIEGNYDNQTKAEPKTQAQKNIENANEWLQEKLAKQEQENKDA